MSTLRRRVLLALIIVGAVINYADRQIIALLKPLLEVDLHWTDAEYGQLASAFQFAAAFGLLFAGRFVDRTGVKWANPLAVGLWSTIATLQSTARTLWQFGVMRVTLGAAEAFGTPVMVKSVAVLLPPAERSAAFGAMNAASTGGAIVTPLFVPALAEALGWRSAFAIVGATGLAWVGAWLAAAHGADLGESRPRSDAPRTPWRAAVRDRNTWAVAGAKVLSDQTWWFLLFWAPDLLRRLYHLDIGQTSVPLAVMYSCAASGAVLGGLTSRQLLRHGIGPRQAHMRTLMVCAALAVPAALLPIVHQEWLTVSLLSLTLAAHQGFSVNLFALITEVVPLQRLATVTGIGAFAGNLGGMGILALTGWMLSAHGGYNPLFPVVAVSYLLALAWIHVLSPPAPAVAPLEPRHAL